MECKVYLCDLRGQRKKRLVVGWLVVCHVWCGEQVWFLRRNQGWIAYEPYIVAVWSDAKTTEKVTNIWS